MSAADQSRVNLTYELLMERSKHNVTKGLLVLTSAVALSLVLGWGVADRRHDKHAHTLREIISIQEKRIEGLKGDADQLSARLSECRGFGWDQPPDLYPACFLNGAYVATCSVSARRGRTCACSSDGTALIVTHRENPEVFSVTSNRPHDTGLVRCNCAILLDPPTTEVRYGTGSDGRILFYDSTNMLERLESK